MAEMRCARRDSPPAAAVHHCPQPLNANAETGAPACSPPISWPRIILGGLGFSDPGCVSPGFSPASTADHSHRCRRRTDQFGARRSLGSGDVHDREITRSSQNHGFHGLCTGNRPVQRSHRRAWSGTGQFPASGANPSVPARVGVHGEAKQPPFGGGVTRLPQVRNQVQGSPSPGSAKAGLAREGLLPMVMGASGSSRRLPA